MATIVSHAVIAFTLGKVFPGKEINSRVLTAGMVMAMMPDADVIGFGMGIPYESMWGHRGFTHSVLFALLFSLIITQLFSMKSKYQPGSFLKVSLFLFFATLSHGLIDAMTTGGLGVGFFIPFSPERYFFEYRPVLVSRIGFDGLLGPWAIAVYKSEFRYLILPCLVILVLSSILKKRLNGTKGSHY